MRGGSHEIRLLDVQGRPEFDIIWKAVVEALRAYTGEPEGTDNSDFDDGFNSESSKEKKFSDGFQE